MSYVQPLAFLAILTGCAPFAGTSDSVFSEIEGKYVLGPNICDDVTTRFVEISNGMLVDHTGTIHPKKIRIDELYKGVVEYGEGSENELSGAVYYAYTFERHGATAVSVFTELPKEDWKKVRSENGFDADGSKVSDGRDPLIFTRTTFDRAPTPYQVETWLRNVPDEQIKVLERCA